MTTEKTAPNTVRITGRVRPYWAVAVAGLLAIPTLGLSLFLLRVKTKGVGTATLTDGAHGLHVRLSGQMPDFLPSVIEHLLGEQRPLDSGHQGAFGARAMPQPPMVFPVSAYPPAWAPVPVPVHPSLIASAPPSLGAQNGTAQNGTAQNGTAQNGTAQNGTAQNGASHDGDVADLDVNSTIARPRQIDLTTHAPLLRFDSGVAVTVNSFALVGRAPTADSDDPPAQLLPIADPELSVSKTHLAVGVDAHGTWVCDRHSTNGSAITDADGAKTDCVPGQRYYVSSDSTVHVGDRSFSVVFSGASVGRAH